MKRLTYLFLMLLMSASASANTPNKIVIPNIEGYRTLKGDFHVHTMFSDGTVWPTARVQEAIWEGLDVLAITDHIDTRSQKWKNKGILSDKCDRNTSYKLAKQATNKSLLVIHGGELSRGVPSGHCNALFIKDNEAFCAAAEAFNHDNALATEAGLKEARNQGAFTMWNHPNWHKHAPNETVMQPIHKKLIKKGMYDAIEVYNAETGYSPEAHEWCLKHNLAIMGCSDTHAPFVTKIDYLHGQHRVVTLVFAKEKTEASVREAMDARRTAIYAEDMVYGREQELKPLFEACVRVKNVRWTGKGVGFILHNVSSIPVRLTKAPGSENCAYWRNLYIPPFSYVNVSINNVVNDKVQSKMDKSINEVVANFYVENFHVGADKPLKVSIKLNRPE